MLNITGSASNDIFTGSPQADVILGGLGDDQVLGLAGSDLIYGNQGLDVLYGNADSDLIFGGRDDDEIYGGRGADVLLGDLGSDLIYGDRGDDSVRGGVGNDVLIGGSADIALRGLDGNDTLEGESGSDRLFGNFGQDLLIGGTGDDFLFGGRDNDALQGGEGRDVLGGDVGADFLTGGSGGDIFIIGQRSNGDGFATTGGPTRADADRITDFVRGSDQIQLITPLQFSDVILLVEEGNTVIQDRETQEFLAIVEGVTALDAGDFGQTVPPVQPQPVQPSLPTEAIALPLPPVSSTPPSAPNVPPVAIADAFTTNQNTAIAGENLFAANPTTADSDPDGTVLTVSQVNGSATNVGSGITLGSGALLTVNPDGTFTYDPNGQFDNLAAGATATDSFEYQIDDGRAGVDTATATVTISGLNDTPIAEADTFSTPENVVLTTGNVLGANPSAGDRDPDGDSLTITEVNGLAVNVGNLLTLGSGALLTLNSDGTFIYDPNGVFNSISADATETFSYQISDGNGGLDMAIATITITPVNDPPAVDLDASSAGTTFTSGPFTEAAGAVNIANSNAVITDPETADQIERLTVTVTNPEAEDLLLINGGAGALPAGISIDSTANGTPTGSPLTLTLTLTGAAPPADYTTALRLVQFNSTSLNPNTTDRNITVVVNDGELDSPTAVSTLGIVAVNTNPDAIDDAFTTDQNTPITSGNLFAANPTTADSDPEGASLTVTQVNGVAGDVGTPVTLPSGALLTVNTDGTFTYNPNGQFNRLAAGASGTDTFTYQIGDGNGGFDTATARITINGTNDAPVAQDDVFTITEDQTITGGNVLAANPVTADRDRDVDTGSSLTVTQVNGNGGDVGNAITLPSGAQLTLNSDGTFDYDPTGVAAFQANTANATDSFIYTLSDGTDTDTATVTITLTPVNDVPVVDLNGPGGDANFAATFTEGGGAVRIADTNATLADVDTGDNIESLTITLTNAQANDGLAIAGGTGALPVGIAQDGASTATMLVLTGASAPANYATALRLIQFENTSDNPSAVARTITVVANDGDGNSTTTTSTISVIPVNDPPVAVNDTLTTNEDTALTGDNLLNANGGAVDRDPENDSLAIAQVNGSAANVGTAIALTSGAQLTVNPNGTFTYNPNGAFDATVDGGSANDSFTYTLSDGSLNSNQATVTINITGLNDAPVAVDDAFSTDEDTTLSGGNVFAANPTTADSDADTGNTFTVVEVNGVAGNVGNPVTTTGGGQLTLNSDGTFTYNPNGAFEGIVANATDTFTYRIRDNSTPTPATSNLATGTITIAPVNDAPINTVPGAQTTVVSTPIDFTGISIADVDAGASVLESVISTTVGTLTATPGSGATVTGDNSNSVTIAGTLTQINAALNGLDFNPGGTPGSATITLTTDDQGNTGVGGAQTDTDAIAVTISPPNAIPVVDLNGAAATGIDAATTFTENGGAIDIAPSGTITDGDAGDNIERLTVTLTNPQTADALSLVGGAMGLPAGISLGTLTATTIVLTGAAPLATYQTALRQVQFNNSSENPNTTTRTVTVVANDGEADSGTATSAIAITAVNDPPTITAPSYTGNANLTLTVADGTGDLLDGATDAEGTSVSVVAATLTSAQAAATATTADDNNVVVLADGSFTFKPVPGYVGDDTFVYQLQDTGSPPPVATTDITATVTLTDLNGAAAGDDILWFIDEDSTGANLGTQADPFRTLAAFNAASTGDGDFVFLDTDSGDANGDGANSYGGGITLANNQTLIGDGTTGTILATLMGITLGSHNSLGSDYTAFDGSGTNPTLLNGSGNAINLGSGNTVRGVDVGNASGFGIRGTAVGALAIEDVAINNATGGGFEVATSGTLNVTLTNLTSGGGTNGVNLTGASGTFSAPTGAIAGATGTAFNVLGGSATVTYGGTINNTAGQIIAIQDTTGGSVTFNNATANAYTDSGTGILIDGAAGNVTLSNGEVGGGLTIQGDATNNASGNYTFNDVRLANGDGIAIFGIGGRITGTLDFNNVDIVNPTGGAVIIAGFNGSTIDFDANSSISSSSSGGTGITVLGSSSGSTTFNGPITLNSGAQEAVSLTGNQNAYTTNFLGGLDITTSTGTGLATSNAGTLNLTGTNNINSTAGTAIDISGATIGTSGITFNNVTSTNATGNGITLGSLNGGNFGITGTTTVSGSGGDGINIGVSDATIAFADVRVSGTTEDGIDLLATTGPVTFTTVAIDDTTGAGVRINQNTGTVNINGGTLGETATTAATTGGDAVNITDSRADITIAAAITNTAGNAVDITNSGGSGTTNTIDFTGAIADTGAGIFLNNNDQNAGTTTVNFTGGLTLNTGSNNAFTATNGGTVTVQGSSNTITAGTGTAINLNGVAIGSSGFTLNSVTSTNATGDGINLQSVTGNGAFTITGTTTVSGSGGRGVSLTDVAIPFTATAAGGSITNVTGTAFNISGSSAAVTYGGTINNTAGRSVNVQNSGGATANTIDFTGAITDSGTGIFLDNNDQNAGATVNFTGGLTLNTGTNNAFTATNGGTVTVQGTNNITTGTGIALNVSDTTIGTVGSGPSSGNFGLNFQSISANGGSSGIILSNAGTGGFRITGDGDSSNGNNTSGGTITNAMGSGLSSAAGHGIFLRNVENISLFEVEVTNSAQNNIDGEQVLGFLTLDNVTLSGAMGSGAGGQADGTNVEVRNTSGDLTYTVSNSTFANPNGESVEFRGNGSATATFNVTNNTFNGGNTGINAITDTGSTGNINFTATGNTMTNMRGAGIGMGLNGTGSSTFNLSNNNITLTDVGAGLGIGFTIGGSGNAYIGTISDNTITNTAGTNTNGIRSVLDGNGNLNLTMNGNMITGFTSVGIDLMSRAGSGRLNADITNNTATEAVGFGFGAVAALFIATGNGSALESNQICANVSNNTLTTNNTFDSTISLNVYTNTTAAFEGLATGTQTDLAAANHLISNNTLTAGTGRPLVDRARSDGNFEGSADCIV